jgi:hypothetical protein
MKRKYKSGQEEFVGFAVIIIIVAVVLLIFLSISLRTPQKDSVESYEVESFLQAMLQYTTDCEDNLGRLDLQKIIFNCHQGEICLDGRSSCEVLSKSTSEIIETSWKKEDGPISGYLFNILKEEENFLNISWGKETGLSRGGNQYFSKGGTSFEIILEVYGN